METVEIVKSVLDVGLAGLLLYFLMIVWKDREEEKKHCQEVMEKKDNNITETNKEILNVIKENTKTQEDLRSTIQEHIKVTETLTNKIYDILNR